ncbi:MAG: DASH family cryptochrome [Pseudomonadales bacterium]|nr:DASH family cryptochrome [Pseudomonadales bacterium]
MATLYLLTDDLRVEDNPALNLAAKADRLAILYCVDDSLFRTDRFGCRGMGRHRWRFLRESLQDLNQSLAELGQVLHLKEGDPRRILTEILNTGRFNQVIRTRGHDARSNTWWRVLAADFPSLDFVEVDSSTLYQQHQLEIEHFPQSFSAFRRALQNQSFRQSVQAPCRLPASVELDSSLVTAPSKCETPVGGSLAASTHLENYFRTGAASTYKETRNALQGQHYSTGVSSYLAHGCISPIQVYRRLSRYEEEIGRNESTHWILFELLWREFFRWYGEHHGDRLFDFSGIQGQRPLTSFYRERFLKWSTGQTPWSLINAAMHELNETGLLSNLARQIVASCLVNELGVDWRCGASYFAEQLIDYDACSNWGNWQYIAGVGADPRGGRHFNIEKQTEMFDPDGSYRSRWSGEPATAPLDSLDYYDWPVEQQAT